MGFTQPWAPLGFKNRLWRLRRVEDDADVHQVMEVIIR
jgi:hypothetical protein